MRYYFTLQYRMLNRQWSEWGFHPLLGYLLVLLAFAGFSGFLFYKTIYAAYIYSFIAVAYVTKLGTLGRNDFLKTCFSRGKYLKIRLLENVMLVLPFCGVLLYSGDWMIALALLAASGLLVFFVWGKGTSYSLPTPFYKWPFEFTMGFRSTFVLFLLAFFLTYKAVEVGNFNLGVFSVLLVFLTCLSYYYQPETNYYVWVSSFTPRQFLLRKIGTALVYSTILCLPISISLGVFFPDNIHIILIVQCLGYVYLVAMVLAKYSAFPNQINVPQGILLALGIWLPPLLLGIIPFFYSQSIKRLNLILK